MNADENTISLAMALRRHCRIENETSGPFLDELKKLSQNDREWLKKQFEEEFGYSIKD